MVWATACAALLLSTFGVGNAATSVTQVGAAGTGHLISTTDPACPNCPPPAPCPGCWQPPLGARWQYQLQAKPGIADDTGGIDVNICESPVDGSDCVTPTVFDIDLYVDQRVVGDGNFVVDTAAVDAIHAAGGHAICYLDAGDAETYRSDYQQFVDFDHACHGCLIGNPSVRCSPTSSS